MKRLPLVVLCGLLLSGSSPQLPNNGVLERELQSLTDRGLHVQLLGEVVEATDPVSGETWHFSMKKLMPKTPPYTGLPTLTIDLRTLDTNQFNWKFRYENSLPISSDWGFPLQVRDIDGNAKAEAYGVYQTQSDYFTQIYDRNDNTNWSHRFTYPIDTGVPDKSSDIDGNGRKEIYCRYRDSLFVFEQVAANSLPVLGKFRYRQWFYGASGIPNQLFDINNDSYPEVLFQGTEPDTANPPFGYVNKTYIAKYIPSMNNLVRIWSAQLPINCVAEGCAAAIACGDFDGDGLQEFVTSAQEGGVFVVEQSTQDSFLVVWSDSTPVGWRAASGDVDGNGVTEFFVGGTQPEADGFVHLRAYAFERTGDNAYQPVFEFNIFPVGLFFVDLYQTVDVDGDDIPELILSFGGGPVIIRGIGSHNYEVFYYTPAGYLDAATAVTIGNEKGAHLFVSRHLGGQPIVKRTDVYSLDSSLVSVVESGHTPNIVMLTQNFPNPFNGSTNIQFNLKSREFVRLTIHDITGKEVARLVELEQQPGSHTVTWNPVDPQILNELASGIYFYKFTVGKRSFARKMVYLK